MKRRSVLEIQRYGHSRVASAKNKEKQGVTTLSELIESPSAKANGCHDVEAPPSLIGAKSKGKGTQTRCSKTVGVNLRYLTVYQLNFSYALNDYFSYLL